MFSKILIANRGEIACRIIKTARLMGVATVAVYSDADRHTLPVRLADESVPIGPAPSSESYLVIDKIIQAAVRTGAQAIHPGYGFLSENAEFCQKCHDNNIVFIGPSVKAIASMGCKAAAKHIMANAGVPVVPGYHGEEQSLAQLKRTADKMGYPVLLKATAGGGGKGMRTVLHASEFDQALASAKREAVNAFNDDTMLVEKYLLAPRHIEVQVFCDQHQNAVYLFERDCSVQRRHQKVIEEAPAPSISETLRQQMGAAAISAASAIDYVGAGTVEFLLDKNGDFFFMEMNTRLQVEHPVTEMICGQDLVEWQLRVACGEPLPCSQDQLQLSGHAFEARIYAEDPDRDFLPATGTIERLLPPEQSAHVRIDSGVQQGDQISVYYDPMIAKLIVWDTDRTAALQRLTQALSEYQIDGVTTNSGFLYNLATSQAFCQADVDTGFIEQHRAEIFRQRDQDISHAAPLAAATLVCRQQEQAAANARQSNDPYSPWHLMYDWQPPGWTQRLLNLRIQQQQVQVAAEQSVSLESVYIQEKDQGFDLFTAKGYFHCQQEPPDFGESSDHNALDQLSRAFDAPMSGTLISVPAKTGQAVCKGETLLVMEAMKMEHRMIAPVDGKVTDIYFQAGDLVEGGTQLLAFERDSQ